jgi:hypothetical protein
MEYFPDIRVFSSEGDNLKHVISSNTGLFRNLTHLKLAPLWASEDSPNYIALPHLHTLTISYSEEQIGGNYEGQDYHLHYSFWSMPNLINLSIIGFLDIHDADSGDTLEDHDKEFNFLLEKIGSSLQGLSFALILASTVSNCSLLKLHEVPSGVWSFCPNLKTIRAYPSAMNRDIPHSFLWPTIEIILCDFDNPQDYLWLELDSDRRNTLLSLYRFFQSPIVTFGMNISWYTLYKRLKGLKSSKQFIHLDLIYNSLSQMRWGSRDFKDRYGKGMDSVEASRVMLWLESTLKEPKSFK